MLALAVHSFQTRPPPGANDEPGGVVAAAGRVVEVERGEVATVKTPWILPSYLHLYPFI